MYDIDGVVSGYHAPAFQPVARQFSLHFDSGQEVWARDFVSITGVSLYWTCGGDSLIPSAKHLGMAIPFPLYFLKWLDFPGHTTSSNLGG